MIALGGTTLATARYSDCRSILKTFAKYEKNGLLPNLFPEGGMTPMYNSADAPLLFVNAVYEYIQASGDNEFLHDCFEPMKILWTPTKMERIFILDVTPTDLSWLVLTLNSSHGWMSALTIFTYPKTRQAGRDKCLLVQCSMCHASLLPQSWQR